MLATEFALKKIPVRVCGVAPGVYESEMTAKRLAQGGDAVNAVGLGVFPVPAGRAGTYVAFTITSKLSRKATDGTWTR